MTDELKQWEYDRGYEKGKADVLDKIRADVINIADSRRSMSVRSVINIIDKYREVNE